MKDTPIVKTSVETIDEVKVKLTVEVEPERVKKAFDQAARALAQQVNLPGFRPGKVPRRILEQRLGSGAIAQAALEDVVPDLYAEAIRAEDINPVAQPEVDVERFDEHEGGAFTAMIEVRPTFDPPDHTGIAVLFPDWEVSDADVDEHLATIRDRFAEVDEVDRTAAEGDMVTIDLEVSVDGQVLEDARVSDALYEVGSGGVTPKLDEVLVGVSAGDDVTYEDALPEGFPEHGGAQASFAVHVTDVRAKTLPELDDDFAATASSFDTMDELRADVRAMLQRMRIEQARHELRGRVVDAYLARVEVPLPDAMIEAEIEDRMHRLEHQAEQYGTTVEALLEAQETTREAYEEEARTEATGGVKARVVLDRLAEHLGVGIETADIEQEIMRHAQVNGMSPDQVAQIIQEQGSLPALIGDIVRRKAIDEIVEAADVEGAPSDDVLREVGLVDEPVAVVEEPTDASAGADGDAQAEVAATDDADAEQADERP